MQIAVCHQNVLPARGGAETYVADLTRRLAAAGHELHLYACRWDAAALPDGIVIHPLPIPRGPRMFRPWLFSRWLRQALDRDRPQVSIGFDKTLGPDVYYPLGGLHVGTAAHNLLKHAAGWRRGIAWVCQRLDAAQQSYTLFEREQLTGPRQPLLVVNSEFVRRAAAEYYGLDPAGIRVVHNAIDPNRFDESDRPAVRAAMRREWSVAPEHVVGAILAMNYRLKGLEPLLRAVARLPADSRFRLVVAGNPKTATFERIARRLGIADKVRFIGHCRDSRRVFFAADMLVHPTYYDPCSLVVLEAMACGLPVITSGHNGAGELVRTPAEGHIVSDPSDCRGLAAAIADLLGNTRRRQCASAARLAATRWTIDDHLRAMEGVLGEAARRRNRQAG